jgi:drug/metabolite transporter (DMT)-like permease
VAPARVRGHHHPMGTLVATVVAMLAFAGNSLLCRVALRDTAIDPMSFTTLRIAAGALVLWAIVRWRDGRVPVAGSWGSGAALFAYAILFSLAYVSLGAATGALLLFGAVQATMIGTGLARGERLRPLQWAGFACALGGLYALLAPGLEAPPIPAAAAMLGAGAAWGVYSLRARRSEDPTTATAGNFARALPPALVAGGLALPWASIDVAGAGWAIASGALTSGLGYTVWYAALRGLSPTVAATVQLSVPAIAAAGGVAWLGEAPTARLVGASVAVLGGIAVVVLARARVRSA